MVYTHSSSSLPADFALLATVPTLLYRRLRHHPCLDLGVLSHHKCLQLGEWRYRWSYMD